MFFRLDWAMPQNQPDMALITNALRPFLHRGVRNIYIWDGDHRDPTTPCIVNSPEMYNLMREFGQPVYIVEDADGLLIPSLKWLSKLSPSQRAREIQQAIASLPAGQQATFRANIMLLDRVFGPGGASVIAPDPRPQILDFSDAELAMYGRIIALSSSGNTLPSEEQLAAFFRTLGPQDRGLARRVVSKVDAIFTNIDALDPRINARIGTEMAGLRREGFNNLVTITQYGAGHFFKPNDLDERAPGVSITVVPRPGHLGAYYRNGTASDLPDFVYYSESRRLVRLNTGEAMMEFIGRDIDPILPYFMPAIRRDPRFLKLFDANKNGVSELQEVSNKLGELGLSTVASVNPDGDPWVTQQEFFGTLARVLRERAK